MAKFSLTFQGLRLPLIFQVNIIRKTIILESVHVCLTTLGYKLWLQGVPKNAINNTSFQLSFTGKTMLLSFIYVLWLTFELNLWLRGVLKMISTSHYQRSDFVILGSVDHKIHNFTHLLGYPVIIIFIPMWFSIHI